MPEHAYPRSDWTSACWGVPNLYAEHVDSNLFQFGAKFASDAVHQALCGHIPWAEVGLNGLYLSIVDVMLQANDRIRTETVVQSILNDHIRGGWYPTYQQWKDVCDVEIEAIFVKVSRCVSNTDQQACAVLPLDVSEPLTLEEARHYCSAALMADFALCQDAGECPPRDAFVRVDLAWLGQYTPTAHRLAQYGMGVVSGSVSNRSTEGELLARARRWKDANPHPPPPNALLGPPLQQPVYPPIGPVPGTNLEWVELPEPRGGDLQTEPRYQ